MENNKITQEQYIINELIKENASLKVELHKANFNLIKQSEIIKEFREKESQRLTSETNITVPVEEVKAVENNI